MRLIQTIFGILTTATVAAFLSTGQVAALEYGADVDEKNGNLNLHSVDLQVITSASLDLLIRRAYNSRSRYAGIFGVNWCSNLETRLLKDPAGGYLRIECGAGVATPFTLRGGNAKQIETYVDTVVREDPSLQASKLALLQSPMYRIRMAKIDLTVNDEDYFASFLENGRGPRTLTVTSKGYRITSLDRTYELFDRDGKLIEEGDSQKTRQKYQYEAGRLVHVENEDGKWVSLQYDKSGFVTSAGAKDSVMVSYSYNPTHHLLYAIVGDQRVTYQYDKVGYIKSMSGSDGGQWSIRIDPQTGRTDELLEHDGCRKDYTYPKDESDAYSIVVSYKNCRGHPDDDTSHITLSYGTLDSASRILKESIVSENGMTTTVEYHPVFQKPSHVTQKPVNVDEVPATPQPNSRSAEESGGDTANKGSGNKNPATQNSGYLDTLFEFDAAGNVIKSTDANTGKTESVEIDPLCGKVSTYQTGDVEYWYDYDQTCDLVRVRASDGRDIRLAYDAKGRILNIQGAEKSIFIEYEDHFGKPSTVSSDDGEIIVTYKTNGDIESVTSPQGPSVSVRVASLFNELLDLTGNVGIDASKFSLLGKNCSCSSDVDLFSPN